MSNVQKSVNYLSVDMATRIISLTELRPRLSELVERARARFERFVITRHGKAEAVLLSAEEFDGLLETLEILADEEAVRELAEAEAELEAGAGHDLGEVRRQLADSER